MSDENPADAFDEVPRVDQPTEQERAMARAIYPPDRVPDEGPIPDPTYGVRLRVTVDVPGWVAESVEHQIQQAPGERDAEDIVRDYVTIDPTFVGPDGDVVGGGDDEKTCE